MINISFPIYESCLVAFIIYVIALSSLFERFRMHITNKSNFLGELVSCPFCLSFWVGIVIVVLYEIHNLGKLFFIIIFANIVVAIIKRGYHD